MTTVRKFIEGVRGQVEVDRRRFRSAIAGKRPRPVTMTDGARRALDSDPPAALDVRDDETQPVSIRLG